MCIYVWGAWWAAVHGVARSRTRLSDFPFTFHFHALEKEMATRSSVLAWRIPGTGEPGGLLSMGSHRVGHDWSDLAAAAPCVFMCVYKCHWLKKIHNVKVENYVLSSRCTGVLSSGDTASQLWGTVLRGKEGTRIYWSLCNKSQVVQTSKDYC